MSKKIILAVGLCLLTIGGHSGDEMVQGENPGPYLSIGPVEAKRLIESREDLLLIDVRSLREYPQGVLPGSTLIPFQDIKKGSQDLPKNKLILLVCASGGRSYAAGKYLAKSGYRKVYNLSGGLSSLMKQRVPLTERRNP